MEWRTTREKEAGRCELIKGVSWLTQRNKHLLSLNETNIFSQNYRHRECQTPPPRKKYTALFSNIPTPPPPLFFSFGVQIKHSMSIFTGNSQVFQFRGDNPSSVSSHNLFTVLLFLCDTYKASTRQRNCCQSAHSMEMLHVAQDMPRSLSFCLSPVLCCRL